MKKATKKQWEELFDLSEQVSQIRPWQHFDDSQIILLRNDTLEDDVYVNILGNAKQTYGIVFYVGRDNFDYYCMTMNSDYLDIPADYIVASQTCLTTYYDKEENIADIDIDILKKYHPNYDRQFAPHFTSYKGSYYPWTPYQDDVKSYIQILKCFIDVFPQIDVNQAFEKDLTTCEYKDNQWNITYQEQQERSFSVYEVEYPELDMKELKHVNEEWELDFHVFPIPINKTKLGRPMICGMSSAIRTNDSFSYIPILLKEGGIVLDTLAQALVSAITQSGIPNEVYVGHTFYEDYLQPIADTYGFKIYTVEELPLSRDFKEYMTQMLMMGEPDNIFS